MSDKPHHIFASATFTADQVTDVIGFWAGYLGRPVTVELAPYAQVYQQLLQPASALRRNAEGANVLLVRWKDLAVDLPQGPQRAARELVDAVQEVAGQAPLLVVLCPEPGNGEAVEEANRIFAAGVAELASVTVVNATQGFALYSVDEPFDTVAEKTGHVPYTADAYAALGTVVFRWVDAGLRRPVKLIATDCDNTLWGGVVGEDGVDGIDLAAGYRALQARLVEQAEKGKVICLLSKNDERDVAAVFEQRSEMQLTAEQIVSRRVDWSPKPENLADLTSELNLGLNSVLFLDDSTVEVAAMRAFHPDVMTVRVPEDESEFQSFCDHLWLIDQYTVTREDQSRVQMYKEQGEREASRRSATSLREFFETLELEVSIIEPGDAELPRFSQLTQRTNQFNTSLARLSLQDVQQAAGKAGSFMRILSVRDRFGDYGIVGAIQAQITGAELVAEVFLLSCRALGRGIEHQMVASLGQEALSQGLETIRIHFEEGPRNQPAREFLTELNAVDPDRRKYGDLVIPAEEAARVRFDPTAITKNNNTYTEQIVSRTTGDSASAAGLQYQRIANEFTTAQTILEVMRGAMRDRPDLATGYIAPSSQMERTLAAIWQDVLRIERIGTQDPFTDLGGKSIQLVQIHSLIQSRLAMTLEFTALFEYGTIATLAKSLEGAKPAAPAYSSANRSQKMRAARNRRAAAMRETREA